MIFPAQTSRPEVTGTFGAVSSTNWLASAAGMAVLETGGNAFDAAVAAGFALQVVEPQLCGPGGEVVIMFVPGKDGRPRVLSGQGPAPARASTAEFRGLGLDMVPGTGLLPAPVPGAFDAWLTLLRDFGTKEPRDVLGYAAGYAADGHALMPDTAYQIGKSAQRFTEDWPSSAEIYLGRDHTPFTRFRNTAVAETFGRLLAQAGKAGASREGRIDRIRREWSQGFVAEAVDRFARRPHRDSTGTHHAGLIAGDDMACYQAAYEEPVCLRWRDWRLYKAGPWTQGPVLLQQLALLDGFGDLPDGLASAEFTHLFVEAAKLAYADRDAFYGDRSDVPLATLLSAGYNDARRRLITAEASAELRPGRPDGREPRMPARADIAMREGKEQVAGPHGDTCHLDVADRFGNVVSATVSGGFLTSSPVIEPLGFPLATRLEMTWVDEGLPNTLTPGKRPRTTLSPTLAVSDDGHVLAFGSPGADAQEQWSLIFFLSVAEGRRMQEAMDAPMWDSRHLLGSLHPHEFRVGQVFVEEAADQSAIDELARRGHHVSVRKALSRLCAVGLDKSNGIVRAAADPRRSLAYACGR